MKLTLLGSAKGHKFTAVQSEDGTCEITAWLLPGGQPAPKKTRLVGTKYPSATAAGRAVYFATHEHYGFPEKTQGRSLVFKADTVDQKVPRRTKSKPIVDMAALRSLPDKVSARRAVAPDKIAALIRASGALPKIPGEKRGNVRTSIQATLNQEGVSEGYCRFWCIDCGDSFIGRPGEGINGPEPPLRCPKGHICIDLRPNAH